MKLALIIITLISLLTFTLFYSTTDSPLDQPADMPWHITVHDPDRSEVFGIVLNETSLEQARQHFGQLDGLALFQSSQGVFNLEAYFGKVSIGPFSARLIANLAATQAELEGLTEHAIKRIKTEDGSIRWSLNTKTQIAQGTRKIKALSYIPGYAGMDQAYILQRFGEPALRQELDESTQRWLYPALGLRILIDEEGKELFEYMSTAQFNIITGND